MPDVPLSLERVIARALAKQPEDRYANADLLRRDLERVAAGLPVSAPPLPGSEPLPSRHPIASEAPIASPAHVVRPQHFAWALATDRLRRVLLGSRSWAFGSSGERRTSSPTSPGSPSSRRAPGSPAPASSSAPSRRACGPPPVSPRPGRARQVRVS
jgi:hypothetical protein